MEKSTATITQPRILWLQVWGLTAIQAAITLSWVIYKLYLPQLLVQFGFAESFAVGLLIVEHGLAVVFEPLFGGLSDNSKNWVASRFPFISLGVILSSALFIIIPCIVTFIHQPSEALRWVLPIVLLMWSLAMAVFRSPALALLGRYASKTELPLAGSLLTLAGGVISASRSFANNFILSLGPVFTFAIGSFVLLAAAAVLRFVNPPETPFDKAQTWATPRKLPQAFALILATGATITWGSRLLLNGLGKVLQAQFNTSNVDFLMLWIALILAFAAIPAGAFAVKIGNREAMLYGVAGTILGMGMTLYMGAQIPIIFLIIAGLSLIVNGAIPFALSLVPPKWGGLGVGMYFGGLNLAMCLFDVVFKQPSAIAPMRALVEGAIAFLLAGVCIAASRRFAPS